MSILAKIVHREEDGDASLYFVAQNDEGEVGITRVSGGTVEECLDEADRYDLAPQVVV